MMLVLLQTLEPRESLSRSQTQPGGATAWDGSFPPLCLNWGGVGNQSVNGLHKFLIVKLSSILRSYWACLQIEGKRGLVVVQWKPVTTLRVVPFQLPPPCIRLCLTCKSLFFIEALSEVNIWDSLLCLDWLRLIIVASSKQEIKIGEWWNEHITYIDKCSYIYEMGKKKREKAEFLAHDSYSSWQLKLPHAWIVQYWISVTSAWWSCGA